MRLLVTGACDYNDKEYVWDALDCIHENYPIELVIHDAARSGTASLATAWALDNGVEVAPYPSAVDIFKLGEPDAVVAFPDGCETGVWVARAKKAGIPVWDTRDAYGWWCPQPEDSQ